MVIASTSTYEEKMKDLSRMPTQSRRVTEFEQEREKLRARDPPPQSIRPSSTFSYNAGLPAYSSRETIGPESRYGRYMPIPPPPLSSLGGPSFMSQQCGYSYGGYP